MQSRNKQYIKLIKKDKSNEWLYKRIKNKDKINDIENFKGESFKGENFKGWRKLYEDNDVRIYIVKEDHVNNCTYIVNNCTYIKVITKNRGGNINDNQVLFYECCKD